MSKSTVPTEAFECKLFVDFLRSKDLRFTHVPNATNSRRQGLINKSMGTSPGFPDYIVLIKQRLVFIEMKRKKPARSVVSEEQKSWLADLTHAGYTARVCYGFEEAKQLIENEQRQ